MRTLSATLEAAQAPDATSTRTPYIRLVFVNRDTLAELDLSAKWLRIEHDEEKFGGIAVIKLDNHDLAIGDMRGYYVEIGYGDVTISGNEYATTPRLDVFAQTMGFSPEGIETELTLTGDWERLAKHLVTLSASAPYYQKIYNRTDTIWQILEDVFTEAGMTLNAPASSDGIIDVFEPYFQINKQPWENARDIAYRLMSTCMSHLKLLPSQTFDVVFPQIDDPYDITFKDYEAPYFYSYKERYAEPLPNHIIVYCNVNLLATTEEELWENLIVGEAEDADSITRYGEVIGYALGQYITNKTDADNRAAALLNRVLSESLSGVGVTPHHCGIELYDNVAFVATRGLG